MFILSFLESSPKEVNPEKQGQGKQLSLATLAAATRGEEASFKLVCEQYVPLFRKIWRTFSIDGLEYEDWFQECCVITIKVLNLCQNQQWQHFGWALKRSCLRRAYDLFRERKAVKRIPVAYVTLLDDLTEVVLINEDYSDVEKIIEFHEGMKLFLESCSIFERKIFAGIQSGQTVAELAHRYECKPSSVRSAHARCRKKLKKILK